jgi:hypothetical protein
MEAILKKKGKLVLKLDNFSNEFKILKPRSTIGIQRENIKKL